MFKSWNQGQVKFQSTSLTKVTQFQADLALSRYRGKEKEFDEINRARLRIQMVGQKAEEERTADDIAFVARHDGRDLDKEAEAKVLEMAPFKDAYQRAYAEIDVIRNRLTSVQNRAARRAEEFKKNSSLLGLHNHTVLKPINEVNNL